MTDSETATTMLRQIRDELVAMRVDLKEAIATMREESVARCAAPVRNANRELVAMREFQRALTVETAAHPSAIPLTG